MRSSLVHLTAHRTGCCHHLTKGRRIICCCTWSYMMNRIATIIQSICRYANGWFVQAFHWSNRYPLSIHSGSDNGNRIALFVCLVFHSSICVLSDVLRTIWFCDYLRQVVIVGRRTVFHLYIFCQAYCHGSWCFSISCR